MEIKKIAMTGGPCGGKSSAMKKIKEWLEPLGWRVLIVPETATELINGGVAPWTTGTVLDCQKAIMELQLTKERLFEQAAKTMPCDNILIICDRGALDNKAYLPEEEFPQVLSVVDKTEVALRDSYDGVFQMVTTAKGAIEFYTTANNEARKESPEEAAALDDKFIQIWTGHPHFRIIDNSTDFEGKIQRLLKEIALLLGIPKPLEIERKFLIEYPDLDYIASYKFCKKVEISQTYLLNESNEKSRIRKRGSNGDYVYYETKKETLTSAERIEIERNISQTEYEELLKNADPERATIEKDRYCIAYENQYFELDVFPFWKDKAFLEIELTDVNQEIKFPPFLKIIKEVTDDKYYTNSNIAKELKNESI